MSEKIRKEGNNKLETEKLPLFTKNGEDLIEALRTEPDSIQREIITEEIKTLIDNRYESHLKTKNPTPEELLDARIEIDEHAEQLVNILAEDKEGGDVAKKLEGLHRIFHVKNDGLFKKEQKIKAKMEKTNQQHNKEKNHIPEIAVVETSVTGAGSEATLIPVIENAEIEKKRRKSFAETKEVAVDAELIKKEEVREEVKPVPVISHVPKVKKTANSFNAMGLAFPDPTEATPSPITKIKKEAQKKSAALSKETLKEEKIKDFDIKNFADLTSFLTAELPKTETTVSDLEGDSLFNKTITVLEDSYREAKKAGKEKIEELKQHILKLSEPLVDLLASADIRETSKTNFIQDITKEFDKLTKVIDKKLIQFNKPVNKTEVKKEIALIQSFDDTKNFLISELATVEIDSADVNNIFADIQKTFKTKFNEAEGKGDEDFRSFANEMLDIEAKLEQDFKDEKDPGKLKLLQKIKGEFVRLFKAVDDITGGRKPEQSGAQIDKNESRDTQQKESNSMSKLRKLVTETIPNVDEDKTVLKNIFIEIRSNLADQFNALEKNNSRKYREQVVEKINSLKENLAGLNLTGIKGEFSTKIIDDLEAFSNALRNNEVVDSKNTPVSVNTTSSLEQQEEKKELEGLTPIAQTPEVLPVDATLETKPAAFTTPEHTPSPAEDPIPQAEMEPEEVPEETPGRSIEDMIDMKIPTKVSETIKKDRQFNSWLEKMFDMQYEGEAQTLQGWYETYKEQKVLIDKVREIFATEKASNEIFKEFKTKTDKVHASKRRIEAFEFAMLTESGGVEKVQKIIETEKKLNEKVAIAKNIEAQKKNLVESSNSTAIKLPSEEIYNLLHGEKDDSKKIEDLERFLIDMELNYTHYRGPLADSKNDKGFVNMFSLYNQHRNNSSEHKHTKIGVLGRIFGKLKQAFRFSEPDYDDKKTFVGKIQSLHNAGLLETTNTNKDTARGNMDNLKKFISLVKQRVAKGETIQKAVTEINEPEAKAVFEKVFPPFIQSISDNDRMQTKARSAATQQKRYAQLDEASKHAASNVETTKKELFEAILGESEDRIEFDAMLKKELTDYTLTTINNELLSMAQKKTLNSKDLAALAQKFEEVDEEDAEATLYKRVSMHLAKLEITQIASKKDISLAPESINSYERKFESDDIEDAVKVNLADVIIGKLKKQLIEEEHSKVEQIAIKSFIKYFEDKKAQFK